jgi:L-amino acid N-acyltransferase YncA/quercetin dioxygenase-like cupin family protein
MRVDAAREADLEGLTAIYNDVIATSTAIFNDEPVSVENRRAWLDERRARGFPVLVAREDGAVLGFGSFGDFRAWPGYRTTVEHSVHVDAAHRGRGIGQQLVRALIAEARALGMHAMIAGVVSTNASSLALHRKLGFVEVGRFPEIARKFDQWLELVLLQLPLDAPPEMPRPPYRVLHAGDAFWRPSNQMGVDNTDLAKQLEIASLGARLWRLTPGQASTRHRHSTQGELYVVLEGTGRMRVGDESLTLAPLSAVHVEAHAVRQVFNDTDADALWLVTGAPQESANTLEMTPELLARLYPDGLQALPPELL